LLGAIREHVRTTQTPVVTSIDLLAIGKAQGMNRQRVPEARRGLERDGWIVEAVGGIRLVEVSP
jgi:hypothetical protein